MATVKISDLPVITQINLDTTQTILPVVDISTDETAKITVRTLADGLFHNDALKVGPNEILLANTIAQFSGNSETFLQTNLQNLTGNGSADYVATADIGTNANNYIDLGINNSTYDDPDFSSTKALDGYLYTYGSLDDSADGNLVIGTASAGANVLFIAGGTTEANVIAKITKFGITLNNQSRLEFTDGSIQTVAAASAAFSRAAANTANSASANTIITQGVDATQNSQITAVNQYAQSAFATANDVNGYATSAYATANGANGLAAGAFNTANGANGLASGAFIKANNAIANTFSITVNNSVYIPGTLVIDGLVYANGATYVANAMSIPTTYTSPQTAITLNYQQANIVKTNITSDLVVSHSNIVLGKYIDLFVYNDSGTTHTITHGVSANNSTTKGTTTKVSPYSTKYLKYFTIDSNLDSTYVIESVSENTIESNLAINGIVTIANSGFSATEAAVVITASNNGIIQPSGNDGYVLHMSGKDNVSCRVVADSFGANGQLVFPAFVGRAARGNVTNPTAVQTNDVIARLAGVPFGTTQYQTGGSARIDIVASENHTDTSRGTQIKFYNIANGANTLSQIAAFNANTADFFGAIKPEKGFIYTPNIVTSGATTLTIDFSRDSLIKCNSSTGLTVSFTNYVYGKETVVWFTNTGGSTQSVTHGCYANNSTVGATSFSLAAGTTAMLRYFSIDAGLSDVYVAITKG